VPRRQRVARAAAGVRDLLGVHGAAAVAGGSGADVRRARGGGGGMSARGASRGWSARRAPAAVAAALLAGLVPLARVMDPPAPETEAYFGRVRDEVRAIPP